MNDLKWNYANKNRSDWYNVLNWNKLFFIYILDFLVYVKSIQKYSKPHNDTIHKCSEVNLKGRKKYISGQVSFLCRYFNYLLWLLVDIFLWKLRFKAAMEIDWIFEAVQPPYSGFPHLRTHVWPCYIHTKGTYPTLTSTF